MKKSLAIWQIIGFVFTSIAGVILHFMFEWSNQSIIVAPFSAINESVWEHTKLLFFPMLVFTLIENKYVGKTYKSFWCVKLIGVVLGSVLIPVLYYTINGIFGSAADWINIAIFFIAALISYVLEFWLLNQGIIKCKSPRTAIGILILIAAIFVLMTFIPPHIPIFQDPITNNYGYNHDCNDECYIRKRD